MYFVLHLFYLTLESLSLQIFSNPDVIVQQWHIHQCWKRRFKQKWKWIVWTRKPKILIDSWILRIMTTLSHFTRASLPVTSTFCIKFEQLYMSDTPEGYRYLWMLILIWSHCISTLGYVFFPTELYFQPLDFKMYGMSACIPQGLNALPRC